MKVMTVRKIPADLANSCVSAAGVLAEANVALERARRTLLRHTELGKRAVAVRRLRNGVTIQADDLLDIARRLREDM